MYKTHLIYYDENINFNSENYGYVKRFKNKIEGAFFPVKDTDSLRDVINKLSSINIYASITLVTSGSAFEKIMPICSSLVKDVIIFCFRKEKYLPLKSKYSKLKSVLTGFSEIFNNISVSNTNNDISIIGGKIITFDDYTNTYYLYHKRLAEFFDKYYSNLSYKNSYKNNFINFVETSDVDNPPEVIRWVNRVSEGTVKQFIEAYTGETHLCYSLNRWLRNLNDNDYNSIKYFAGPFSYALYKYAYHNKNQGVYYTKTFYRKMTIKLSEFCLYRMLVGELICYPAFTSTSEKDISKYNFPTNIAINVNKLSSNDISVVLIIKYHCQNSSNPTPCVNASEYSVNAGEEEYIFPPFSFFRIESINEKSGKPDDPHIINMSIPNKKTLLEFGLKEGKKICYNRTENLLYLS